MCKPAGKPVHHAVRRPDQATVSWSSPTIRSSLFSPPGGRS